MSLFEHHPHAHIAERKPPPKVAEHLGGGTNARIGLFITRAVGTMYCAYAFCVLALIGLPTALNSPKDFVAWISSQFIQLVLLPIIIVGQNIQAAAADARSEATYKDADAVLHEALEIQKHLKAQDTVLEALIVTEKAHTVTAKPPRKGK